MVQVRACQAVLYVGCGADKLERKGQSWMVCSTERGGRPAAGSVGGAVGGRNLIRPAGLGAACSTFVAVRPTLPAFARLLPTARLRGQRVCARMGANQGSQRC